ncbi:unnamed protein product [Diamesa serratosioi]
MECGQDLINPRRRILKEVVCALLVEAGFDSAADECIETLLELMTSLLIEMGTTTRNYCELAGRTQPVIGDFVVGLVSMGVVFKDLEKYAVRENRPLVRGLSPSRPPNPLVILQAGNKPNPPTHIIPSHLPPLPDPHAYIRTATYKQPVTEYEAIREKAATQKRDIDRALTRFLAKTSETQSLFDDEENQMYPLIATKSAFPTYLAALNPVDQVFDFEELEYYYQVANRKESMKDTDPDYNEDDSEMEDEENPDMPTSLNSVVKVESTIQEPSVSTVEVNPTIDNPYLRSATIPNKKMRAK